MPSFTPVEHDPFAAPVGSPRLEPVDYDPFAKADVTANPTEQLAPAQGAFPAVTRGMVDGPAPASPQSGTIAPSARPVPQSQVDPGILGEAYGDAVKGMHSTKRGAFLTGYMTGMYDDVDNIANHLAASKDIEAQYPASPSVRGAQEELERLKDSGASGILPSLGVYVRNPRAAASTAVQSLPSMLGTLVTVPVGAVGGGLVAGPPGAAVGSMVGLGVGSAAADFGNAFEDYARDKWKPKDAAEWKAILTDEAKTREAGNYAAAHAGMVGVFDAVGAKLGGKVAMGVGGRIAERGFGKAGQIAGGGAAGAAVDTLAGPAGEAGGQLAGTGVTEGTPRINDPGAIAGEFAAQAVTSGPAVALEPTIHALNIGGAKQTPATSEDIAAAQQVMEQPKPEDVVGSTSELAPQPVFYSPTRKYIEEKGPGAATAEVWQNTLRNAPGIKQEELADLGLPDYFVNNPNKITKRELLDHLDENAIQVQETSRDFVDTAQIDQRQRDLLRQMNDRATANPALRDPTGAMIIEGTELQPLMAEFRQTVAQRRNNPRYQQYTLPGERQGYTELTMHVPTRNVEGDNTQRDFFGGHYSEPNVVVHARVTDRVGRDGVPMALIEEIQSDWHQAGRKEGYRTNAPVDQNYARNFFGISQENWNAMPEDQRQGYVTEIEEDGQHIRQGLRNQVPDGPFKSSWDELAFKRMLRWAADKGYRRVAWVNAAEQSRRYPGDAKRDAGMKVFYDQAVPSIAKKWAKRLGGTMGSGNISSGGAPTAIVTDTGVGTFVVTDTNGQRLLGTHMHTSPIQAQIEADRISNIGNESTVQYVDLPQAAIDLIQRGLPMYSEVGEESKKTGATVRPTTLTDEVVTALAGALDSLIKGMNLPVNVELVYHEGRQIVYKVSGRNKRVAALGMAIRSEGRNQIHIALGNHVNPAEVWATMTHELGHIVMWQKFSLAPTATRIAIRAAYDEFRSNVPHNANLAKLIQQRDNAVVAFFNTRRISPDTELKTPAQRQYWAGFDEWFAEQVARWATTNQKPLTVVERFFKGLGNLLKQIMFAASKRFGGSFEPNKAMADWLNSFHTDAQPMAETIINQTTVETQTANQRQMGPEEKAVEHQPETGPVRQGIDALFNGRPPKEAQEAAAYADKFNKLYKWAMGIHQVAQRNAHIVPLQEYTETIAVAQLTKQQIMIRAQEVLKSWNRLGGKQGDAVAAFIDDVQNMVYLTPDEVKNKVSRFPSQTEIADLVKKHDVSQEGLAVFKQVAETFQEHLTRYEAVLRNEANKITDQKERADRMDSITLQIRALRSKPYFPAMRFGDWTITIRNKAGQVIHFETFERERTRDAAAKELQTKLAPDDVLQISKIAKQARPLLGVPTQLLDLMAAKLTLSQAQRDALEQMKFELSPAQSFKHRFQHKRRIAGYSQDFRRAYANYFFHGANHLMKTMYADKLRGLTKDTFDVVKDSYDTSTRREIQNYLLDHLENWLDPKPDWAAIRSIAFLWSLAWTPAAAAQNLTQTLMTTYPFFAQHFGDLKAVGALTRVGADFTTWYKKGTLQNATEFELKALGRGISDGIINEAMAPELAGFAEGRTLGLGFGGNELQRGLHTFNEWGAKMFEMAEQVNRRLAFRAALKLAQENPGARYVKDMQVKHKLHYDQLRAEGWTEAEANAYVAARDATLETQFQYGAAYRPRMFRGRKSALFVFKTFVQSYCLFLANYPAAAVRSLLILGFLGGLMGVPGGEDLRELLKAIGWRMFGKDFDIEKEARQLIIQFLGETETGRQTADMVLHGVARQGYGIPAFMDMLGGTVGVDIPMPKFDRSAAISAGTLLPVELGKLFGPPTQSTDTVIAGQAQKASGAVFGAGFNVYKALTNQNIDASDTKRWERAVPRALGNVAKAYRVGTEGREKNSKGATVVKYDVRDAEQLMEVIGMAAGYTPYRQSLQWNRIMAGQEAVKLWDIRRTGLMKQMGNAVLGRDEKEIERVKGAIKEFNSGLPPEARGKAISSDVLRQSIGTQARSRQAQEAESSVKKSDIPILRKVQELYPESQATSVRKVRGVP